MAQLLMIPPMPLCFLALLLRKSRSLLGFRAVGLETDKSDAVRLLKSRGRLKEHRRQRVN